MKHSNRTLLKQSLAKTISLVDKNEGVSLRVGSPSLLPFVFSCFDFKKLLVCDSGFFGDIYSSFGVFPEGVVGFPEVRSFDRGDFVVRSFNQELFSQSSIYLSCQPESVNVCVADSASLNSPAISIKKESPLVVGVGGCSKKVLIDFLNQHGYTLVDSVVSPGEFVVRGGVVDVFSYGLSFPFRVGFFDSTQKVLFFNPSTGNVVKKKDFCSVFPFQKEPKKTVLESVTSFYKTTYAGGFLNIRWPKSVGKKFIVSPDVVSVLDYSEFKNNPATKPFFSGLLLSEACVVNQNVFLPFWFSEKLNTVDKEAVPLSGSLCVGDYYIHEMFGVCKYLGFSVFGEKNEKISLAFDDAKMSLDVRFLGRLSFYAPANAGGVQLNSLNKKGVWKRKKQKTLDEASAYVGSLVDSYVNRDLQTNFSVDVDKEFVSRFLFAFPYVDTYDQAAAWKSILKDLVSEKPMHRLLCGDVGFGKTELAMRAAFLLSTNNKKTIVLCPTTILSDQLFNCFNERLSPFGASVAQITRLTKNNTSTAKSFSDGGVDVLIGTHALLRLSDALRVASLIVVDEEHRFGVKDKEKILSLSPGCHYLNMSATPIPRTLQLSLSGIRNISTLLSPPSQRKPIITNIYFYNKDLLKTILLDEMSRGGQVFIVDNSVQNVRSLFSVVSSLLPLFSAGLLYGSMKKDAISKTMSSFRSGKIKILVSTVIIESGIDVPSANTIIINNAHLFGLSQLHQLRGRVGRSSSQSYAYLFLPRADCFSSEGKMRLRAIKKHSSLGSGYRLAIQDLEIRGAGSLFGYKQSGKVSVGFEFYSKLLAVAMKNKKYGSLALVDAEVDLGPAFISSSFMPVDGERAYYYKSISDSVDTSSLLTLLKKTKRLFGRLPDNFYLLFLAKEMSLLCGPTPIIKVVKNNFIFSLVFSPVSIKDVSSFLLLLEKFFSKRNVLFVVRPLSNLIKIQFTYIQEDYYILLKNLAEKTHV